MFYKLFRIYFGSFKQLILDNINSQIASLIKQTSFKRKKKKFGSGGKEKKKKKNWGRASLQIMLNRDISTEA